MSTLECHRTDLPELSEEDIQALWRKHAEPLKNAVRRRMKAIRDPAIDECDVVSISFADTVAGICSGAFPNLRIESEFWPLLLKIAQRRVRKIYEAAATQKRGGNVVVFRQGDLESQMENGRSVGILAHPVSAPAPGLIVELSETLDVLLDNLPNEQTREIVLKKLAGADTKSLADEMGTTSRKIYRILAIIKPLWERSLLARDHEFSW